MSNSSSSSSGIGFAGLLTVLFIGLKLTNYINWSWWWVLSPLWIPFCIVMGIAIIVVIIWLAIKVLGNNKPKYRVPKQKNQFQEKLEELRKQKK